MRRRKGEDAVFVGFHHLGDEIVIGRAHLFIGVPQFHFHVGAGHRLALEFHLALEDVPGIEAEGPGQGAISAFKPTSRSQPSSSPNAAT
jgi:hypothetical protein